MIDISGKKFNYLTAIKPIPKNRRRNVHWLFKCDCGKEKIIEKYSVIKGETKSCGCWNIKSKIGITPANKTHGLNGSKFQKAYYHALDRCNKPHNHKYKRYGARGIKVLWKSFDDFRIDMYDSFIKHIDKYEIRNTTLDRIDVNGNYCKENCRWATWKEQSRDTVRNQFKKGHIPWNKNIKS